MGAHDSISCDCCMRMNAKKAPFQKMAEERSTVPAERVHSDVKELSTRSIEGHLYAVCFVDDATRRCVTYPIKRKDEVIKKLERHILIIIIIIIIMILLLSLLVSYYYHHCYCYCYCCCYCYC